MRALQPLTCFFLKNSNLPLRFFKSLYMSLIDPIILYGSELWCVFPHQSNPAGNIAKLNELDKPLLKFLRTILGVPRNSTTAGVLLETGTTI